MPAGRRRVASTVTEFHNLLGLDRHLYCRVAITMFGLIIDFWTDDHEGCFLVRSLGLLHQSALVAREHNLG